MHHEVEWFLELKNGMASVEGAECLCHCSQH
jgi:hypothetical protein